MTKAELNAQIQQLDQLLQEALLIVQHQHDLLVGAGIDPKTGEKVEKTPGLILPRGARV